MERYAWNYPDYQDYESYNYYIVPTRGELLASVITNGDDGGVMAHALPTFRTGALPATLVRFIHAAARMGFAVGTRERQAGCDCPVPLDAVAMRDIGACREYQDYGCAAKAPVGTAQRLHRIADAARCGLPR
jgi:hypothetical protein